MGRQIIRQPNGLFCVFSSIVDHLILYDATIDEIIEDDVQEYRERITEGYHKIASRLEKGEKPYHQFTMNYDELIRTIKSHHGKNDETLLELMAAATTPQRVE